jgi:hypothetical protein
MKAESFLKKGYRIKLLTIPVLILLVLTAIPSLAGEKTDTMEALKGALKADKKAFIEQYMQLTQAEAKEFWPYYNSYQFDLQKINDRLIKLIDDYAKNYKNLSDQDATKMVDEYLSIERDQLKLKELYFRTLRKTLPVKKVARFLQLENKIRALVQYELAARVPFIK